MPNKLLKEFQYYLEHKEQLVKQYKDKFVVIKDGQVIGSYTTREEAVEVTCKTNELGTFLVQLVTEGEELVQRFYSRVG
jgi:hypothetical protein